MNFWREWWMNECFVAATRRFINRISGIKTLGYFGNQNLSQKLLEIGNQIRKLKEPP